jgi:hypothetical protein
MMHRVKATLPKLQLEDGIAVPAHTTIYVSCREVGMVCSIGHKEHKFPSQPSRATTDKWWKRAKREPLNASHLCLSQNVGLPKQDTWNTKILHGNRVTIVPNVHAVMAWAAKKTLAVNET